MAPTWADIVGWVSLATGFGCALIIVVDEVAFGNRQSMWIMSIVHPITALYWGPVWLWPYFTRARISSVKVMQGRARELAADGADPDLLRRQGESRGPSELRPWHIGDAVSHCGAGCTLGDIGGEWIVWALGPWMIGSLGALGPEYVWDFPLAWGLGIFFQYFTLLSMRQAMGVRGALWLAIRADTLSIISFQVGLFGWMGLSHLVVWHPALPIGSSAHWWMMQVGMVIGFFTAWPVNRRLVMMGWKEKMDHRKHLAKMVEEVERPRKVAE